MLRQPHQAARDGALARRQRRVDGRAAAHGAGFGATVAGGEVRVE